MFDVSGYIKHKNMLNFYYLQNIKFLKLTNLFLKKKINKIFYMIELKKINKNISIFFNLNINSSDNIYFLYNYFIDDNLFLDKNTIFLEFLNSKKLFLLVKFKLGIHIFKHFLDLNDNIFLKNINHFLESGYNRSSFLEKIKIIENEIYFQKENLINFIHFLENFGIYVNGNILSTLNYYSNFTKNLYFYNLVKNTNFIFKLRGSKNINYGEFINYFNSIGWLHSYLVANKELNLFLNN